MNQWINESRSCLYNSPGNTGSVNNFWTHGLIFKNLVKIQEFVSDFAWSGGEGKFFKKWFWMNRVEVCLDPPDKDEIIWEQTLTPSLHCAIKNISENHCIFEVKIFFVSFHI